jgi:mono/diheme cytochrome c family protein
MMRRRSLAGSVGLSIMIAVTAGCPGDDARDTPPPATQPGAPPPAAPAPGVTGDLVQQGQQIYAGAGICFTCHGQNAQGTPLGPNLADGEWIWIDPAQDLHTELVNIIRVGVAQPREYPAPMPPNGGVNLSEDQLEALAAYLVSLNQ